MNPGTPMPIVAGPNPTPVIASVHSATVPDRGSGVINVSEKRERSSKEDSTAKQAHASTTIATPVRSGRMFACFGEAADFTPR
jgi:hypothetical protein